MKTKFKLMWQPIPQTSWGLSLSNLLEPDKWKQIALETYRKYEYKCKYCKTGNSVLHAHEIWEFQEIKRIQRLKEVVCACKVCHDCIHWGRSTQVHGKTYQTELLEHMAKINKCTVLEIKKELARVRQVNYKRVDRRYRVMVGKKELVLV